VYEVNGQDENSTNDMDIWHALQAKYSPVPLGSRAQRKTVQRVPLSVKTPMAPVKSVRKYREFSTSGDRIRLRVCR